MICFKFDTNENSVTTSTGSAMPLPCASGFTSGCPVSSRRSTGGSLSNRFWFPRHPIWWTFSPPGVAIVRFSRRNTKKLHGYRNKHQCNHAYFPEFCVKESKRSRESHQNQLWPEPESVCQSWRSELPDSETVFRHENGETAGPWHGNQQSTQPDDCADGGGGFGAKISSQNCSERWIVICLQWEM